MWRTLASTLPLPADMIDLHLHTTASDGGSSPELLVQQVLASGISTFAVTDHDTVAGVGVAGRLARDAGLRFVTGVEITAVQDGRDVHVLGYFIDPEFAPLLQFLDQSCADRLRRARLICERLAAADAPVSFGELLSAAGGSARARSIARPLVAQALVRAGHVATVQEAFDRFLAEGRLAYVPRIGSSPGEVVRLITAAGGVASLAHPGPLGRDELIEPLAEAGMTALECFHADHDAATTERYLALAREHGLAVTGGSDFHGTGSRRGDAFGRVTLPLAHFEDLADRARLARQESGRRT